MILSCDELDLGDETPNKAFIVVADNHCSPMDILRLCGKIPKVRDEHDDPRFNGWRVNEVRVTGDNVSGHNRVDVEYAPPSIEVAEESDEPRFPPYSGPKGEQPDGSFILTPRTWEYLYRAMLWSTHWGIGHQPDGPPACMAASSMKDFWRVFCKETGMDMETYT